MVKGNERYMEKGSKNKCLIMQQKKYGGRREKELQASIKVERTKYKIYRLQKEGEENSTLVRVACHVQEILIELNVLQL